MPRCPCFSGVEQSLCWQQKNQEHTCFVICNWPLTLMLSTSKEKESFFSHDAAWSRYLRSRTTVASHSAGFCILGLPSTAGLDLCRWQGRFSPAQHTVGNLRRDSLSIYLRQPLPPVHFRVFKALKTIDQHLKLGPAPCPQLRGCGDLASFPRVTASRLRRC